jgi:hypothetical protein
MSFGQQIVGKKKTIEMRRKKTRLDFSFASIKSLLFFLLV